jgi:hypothetical protein
LDKIEGGSIGPTLGQGRGKYQCNNPRNQIEADDYTNFIMSQRDVRDEEYAGRAYHCIDTET